MSKTGRTFSIDESIDRELSERPDINPSGIVNEFLKRYLSGETTDQATKRLELERKRELAEEKAQEARALEEDAARIERELREQERNKRNQVESIVSRIKVGEMQSAGTVVETSDEKIMEWVSDAPVSTSEVKELAIQRYENEEGKRGFQ